VWVRISDAAGMRPAWSVGMVYIPASRLGCIHELMDVDSCSQTRCWRGLVPWQQWRPRPPRTALQSFLAATSMPESAACQTTCRYLAVATTDSAVRLYGSGEQCPRQSHNKVLPADRLCTAPARPGRPRRVRGDERGTPTFTSGERPRSHHGSTTCSRRLRRLTSSAAAALTTSRKDHSTGRGRLRARWPSQPRHTPPPSPPPAAQ